VLPLIVKPPFTWTLPPTVLRLPGQTMLLPAHIE
jgi:hypothetical protein